MAEIDLREKRVTVTGGHGFLGQHVVNKLIEQGVNPHTPTHQQCDLSKESNCKKLARRSDVIIHLAARMGGIGANRRFPAEFLFDNAVPSLYLLKAAQTFGVEKVVVTGTVCEYPENTTSPYREENLWNGYPEPTNGPYGNAKRLVFDYQRALFNEYGFNSIHLLMGNMYGPGERLDRGMTHVIPDVIRKIFEAEKQNKNYIETWGSGTATRDFLYIEDAATAVVTAARLYNNPLQPVNIGSGTEISMLTLIEQIAKLMNYDGNIVWDSSKPDGQTRRLLDTSRASRWFGFRSSTTFKDGLRKTVDWYVQKLESAAKDETESPKN